ncbi:MAG: hypothetical protein IT376_07400 [Polyangiaceae bacterium]|nr:hypothetical protein [Polyangiaceae bacterium]
MGSRRSAARLAVSVGARALAALLGAAVCSCAEEPAARPADAAAGGALAVVLDV